MRVDPRDVPGPARRPVSVSEGVELRDEARLVKPPEAYAEPIPMHRWEQEVPEGAEIQARETHRVVSEWRRWIRRYQNSHIEYEDPNGEIVRAPLENSYQESYARRYYARLSDFERAANREFSTLTTVMLTFTASHRNANGNWRCPGDHMRDVMEGWETARKTLHNVLSGFNWEYARIVEPHEDGYGHLHIAVFVEGGRSLSAADFRPVMNAHVRACTSAKQEVHRNRPCPEHETADGACSDCHTPISLADVDNLGSYLSKYIGLYGEEDDVLDRPMREQAFFAVSWATRTRRLDFSNGAQEMIAREEFRRETGLRAEDRGKCGGDSKGRERDAETARETEAGEEGDGAGWTVDSLCEVRGTAPSYYDPTAGGVEAGPIDGRAGVDPPKEYPAPPPPDRADGPGE